MYTSSSQPDLTQSQRKLQSQKGQQHRQLEKQTLYNINTKSISHRPLSKPSYSPLKQSIVLPHRQILDDQGSLREKFKIRNSISLNTTLGQSQIQLQPQEQREQKEQEEDLNFTPTYHSGSSHHLPPPPSITPPHPFYNSTSNPSSRTNSNSSLNSIINPNLNLNQSQSKQQLHITNSNVSNGNSSMSHSYTSIEKTNFRRKKPEDEFSNDIEFQNFQALASHNNTFNPEPANRSNHRNSSTVSTWMNSNLGGDDDIEDTGIVPENRFPEGAPRCFGLTIKESNELSPFYYDGLRVPIIMYRCLTYLDSEEAYKKVGIFRLNALKTEINRLEDIFNSKGDFDLLKAEPKPNVHAVTTLFKRWLRENEKVLSVEECEQFLKLAQLKNDKIKTREFNSILKSMPDENYGIIRCIIKYLDVVLKYKELNKNSEESLAMLFSAALTEDKAGKNIPVLREFLKNRNQYFV